MKKVTFIFCFIFSHLLYGQGEIVERESRKVNDNNLKIVSVTNDTITYKAFRKIEKIPTSSVIAYRYNCSKDTFIFPNRVDRKNYTIKKGSATQINKELMLKDPLSYENAILNKYKIQKDSLQKRNHITLFAKDSSSFAIFYTKRNLKINLKSDSVQVDFIVNIFKVTNDSMVYFYRKMKNGTEYYAINKKEIKYMKFESEQAYKIRMMTGGFSCGLIIIIPTMVIPIYIFTHPRFRTYDIENKWNLILCDKNNCKPNTK